MLPDKEWPKRFRWAYEGSQGYTSGIIGLHWAPGRRTSLGLPCPHPEWWVLRNEQAAPTTPSKLWTFSSPASSLRVAGVSLGASLPMRHPTTRGREGPLPTCSSVSSRCSSVDKTPPHPWSTLCTAVCYQRRTQCRSGQPLSLTCGRPHPAVTYSCPGQHTQPEVEDFEQVTGHAL